MGSNSVLVKITRNSARVGSIFALVKKLLGNSIQTPKSLIKIDSWSLLIILFLPF